MVTKRRNWLTWVYYDPYEEREPFVFHQPPPAPPQPPAPVVEEKPKSPELTKEDAPEKPRKKRKKADSNVEKVQVKIEEKKPEPVVEKVEEPVP
jgi:hypothetical protein